MFTRRNLTIGLCLAAGLGGLPVLAAGPVDGEIGAVYWANDFDTAVGSDGVSIDAGAPGYRAELWVRERLGFRAGVYSSDLDEVGGESADYTSIDVLFRPFSPMENSFLAVGAGWQDMDLDILGLGGSTSGARLSLEGRVGVVGQVYFYGQGSYLPELDDSDTGSTAEGRFEDLTGQEFELGVSWKFAPFVSLRAGYRTTEIDFTRTGFDALGSEIDGTTESKGVLAGLSFSF